MGSGANVSRLAEMAHNASLPYSERAKAIQLLAQDGSAEALAALKEILARADPGLRIAIAEALADCRSPEAASILMGLLQDPDEAVSKTAIHSLAKQNSAEAAGVLVRMLGEEDISAYLRCEAALSLGSVNQPGVMEALAQTAREADDQDLAAAALTALGERDFSETQSFFQDFLKSPDVAPELRVTAIETLASVPGDPTSFLAAVAGKDSDADARVAAAWALSATEATGQAAPQLLAMLQTETDPDVRLREYQALRNQSNVDPAAALSLVQAETDPSARIAGLDMIAKLVRDNPTPALQSYFAQTGIDELKQIALSADGTLDDRQHAIIALTRARTSEATAALAEITGQMAAQQAQQQAEQQAAQQAAAQAKQALAQQRAAARAANQPPGALVAPQ